ncbi:MAG: phospho-N-acetylmuramoyl-pentapeptide-transferase [Anaerolineales bacterium]|jgi:phospho-N-acetylmuramoyl-pentapeptide-transferase
MSDTTLAMSLAGLVFMMTVIWGGPLLRILRHFKVGKQIRVDEPDKHFIKMGTPTMGGVMIIIPVLLINVLLNGTNLIGMRILGQSVILPLLVMLSFAVLGAIDDWQGVKGKRVGEGMRIRTKFAVQILLGLVIAAVLRYMLKVPEMFLPGINFQIKLGWLYIPVAAFVIVAMSNAVNFTDGLDGMAGLISATIFAAYGGIALIQGQVFIGRFCFTMVGALFGFLWFNVHPAQLFMGDTGSLSLGATIGVIALMTGQWALLPIIAVIPVSEALSDIIQIVYFRLTHGRRFFKMAPIHLHFELLGWSEMQIVQRFWLIGLIAAMLGIGLMLV